MVTTVSIPGMHCGSCIALIKDVCSEFSAITDAQVDLDAKKVTLQHSDELDLAKWTEEIESLGEKYKVTPSL
ncbi:heavy-metal-associated domain-containing protein [Candidatus Gracilibacteria bacterium]|nr:heavy-metal-associated domain-containing protein [Candidatus Gracilibacteria bacterium]